MELGAPVSDVAGRVIIPAFVDSHTHPSCIALTNWRVPLKGNTLEVLLEDAAAYCREHSPEEVPYFFGESFQLTMFDENGPRKELLDRYISDRPARLQDFTDHSCWYNSRALEAMGIRAGEPDPEIVQGTVADIRRDPDGSPTGWVLEVPDDSLDRILYDRIGWHPDLVPTRENMAPFLSFMTRNGITAVMDAIAEEESIALFHQMDMDGTIAYTISSVVNGIKNTVSTVFNAVKSTVSSIFNGIRDTAVNVWNSVSLFAQLSDYLESLPLEKNNAMFSIIVQLCTEHERLAFTEGIRWGFQLHTELTQPEVQ